MDLVKFVVAREEWEEREHLEEDAANAPVVHLVVVVAVSHQTLGRTVPPGRYVLSERRLRVHPATRAEVSQLDLLVLDQDVLAIAL